MSQNEIRLRIDKELYSAWLNYSKKGFCRISVGVGKTWIMINIIKKHIEETNVPKILILVPTQNLRDKTFLEEVQKFWNLIDFHKYCTIRCYQSHMKVSGEIYSLGLFDEFDSIADVQLEGILNNTYKEWLGLSGTYTQGKFDLLESKGFKFIYDYPVSKAQEEGVINKTNIYLYPVPLYHTKKIPNSRGYWSEAEQYNWLDTKIASLKNKSFALYSKMNQVEKDSLDYEIIRKEWKSVLKSKEFLESSPTNKNSRMNVTYKLESTTDFAKELANKLLANPNNKVLVFAQRIESLTAICGNNVYAGKATTKVLDEFNSGNIRLLGGAKKLERGVNLVGLNHGILHSFSSSISENIQRIGRLLRMPVDVTADVHIIVSYYMKNNKIEKCRNYVWFKNVIDGLGMNYTVITDGQLEV